MVRRQLQRHLDAGATEVVLSPLLGGKRRGRRNLGRRRIALTSRNRQ